MSYELDDQFLDLPVSAFGDVEPSGFGMDIGGTLIKVAYPEFLKTDPRVVRIHLVTFANDKLNEALVSLRDVLGQVTSPGQEVVTTGFGCNKHESVINETLNIRIKNEIELECSAPGVRFLADNLPLSEFALPPVEDVTPFVDKYLESVKHWDVYDPETAPDRDPDRSEEGAIPQCRQIADMFGPEQTLTPESCPWLVCFLGSGAFYGVLNGDGSQTFIDINTSCGRMLMGLGSLLTGAKSFQELSSLAEKGDAGAVETRAGDVRDGDKDVYSHIPDDLTVYSYGKAQGKSLGDFRREDLAAACLSQTAQSLAQSVHLARLATRTRTVIFAGTLCCQNHFIRKEITKNFATRAFTNPTRSARFYFMRYGAHVGAIGALILTSQLKAGDKKTQT